MAGKHVRLTCHWSICTVVVCMIVRFKPKITRSFFLLASSIRILLTRRKTSTKTSRTRIRSRIKKNWLTREAQTVVLESTKCLYIYIYILFQSAKYDHQIPESRDLKNLMRLFVLIRPTRIYLHRTKSAQWNVLRWLKTVSLELIYPVTVF